MAVEQLDRIERNTSSQTPPAVALSLRFSSHTSPDDVLENARHVMGLVARAQAADWPSDGVWRQRLPEWFLQSFEGHSLDEMMANPELWDFGSWLDAMKHPGWEWWSSGVTVEGGVVLCVAHAHPFSIEPLIYLLRVAGAFEFEFREG